MPFCTYCGHQIDASAVTCTRCGHPLAPLKPRRTESAAVASLALSIAAFVVPFVGIVTAPLAIVYGHRAKRAIAADPSLEGSGLATTGVIMGWVGVAWALVILLFLGVLFFSRVLRPPHDVGVLAMGSHLPFATYA